MSSWGSFGSMATPGPLGPHGPPTGYPDFWSLFS